MFRRLAESFQNSGTNENEHSSYINKQVKYFDSLPNVILSGTSGLKGFEQAIQNVDTLGNSYQVAPVKHPNDIFMQDASPDLTKLAKQCSSSSIDDLIAIKNPNASVGCGWLYTPPNSNSPYPALSQGFIGNNDSPLKNFQPPEYKKWFFDLQLAKKQILLDKCKALKNCRDIDNDVYSDSCGYCTDTNQGIPINKNGESIYNNDPIGQCDTESIVTSSNRCPAPPGTGSGPQPIIDRTCQAVNGRLSSACLYNQVLAAGCSDNGSLAIALSGSPSPSDYISNIRSGDAVKIYNRVANPPLNLDIFSKGAATVDTVLREARKLAGNTKQPGNTALGAAARDLCLQKGAVSGYNFCNDLPDTTPAPFDMTCLQQLFLKMGGQPLGSAYPSISTVNTYNSMGNLGAVKQYINRIIENTKSSDYAIQRGAMIQLLGISPEKLIARAPYNQGVEIIWLSPVPGNCKKVRGILARTIEKDIFQMGPSGWTYIPQLASRYPGFNQFSAMVQMFDVRAPGDFTTKFTIRIDDGFFMANNQPADIAKRALSNWGMNEPNIFSNMGLQGATTYASNHCFNYNAATPNITKIYYSDAGGGGQSLVLGVQGCSGSVNFTPPYYSLTCEPKAPFLNLEVNTTNGEFDDTRNAGLFTELISSSNVEARTRTDERQSVPGKKGFLRINNNSSALNITNIAYQAWGTVTYAFRLQSMPVKDSLFGFWTPRGYVILYVVPINGSNAQLRVKTSFNADVYGFSNGDGATTINFEIGTWYYLEVAQNGQGFDMYCDSINNIIKNGNYTTKYFRVTNNGNSITSNENYGLYIPNKQSCNITVGGKASGFDMYSGSFQFDLAWVHVYDYYIGAAEVVRDCKADWIFTQFPDSVNTYKTIG